MSASGVPTLVTSRVVKVGGFDIEYPLGIPCDGLALALYLALKARAGDLEAQQVLTAFDASVRDANGLSIWPPHPEPKP